MTIEYLERLPSRAPYEERYERWLVRRDGALAEAHVYEDTDESWAHRVAQHVEPWQRVSHSQASPVYSISAHDGRTVIVIGDERGPRIESTARLLTEDDERVAWVCDAIAGVAELLTMLEWRKQLYAHGRPTRDELFVAPDGVVRLRAPLVLVQHTPSHSYTGQSRAIRGTIWALAPESLKGSPSSPATDVYTLALTLHVALTGVVPFQRGDQLAMLQAILDGASPPPLTLGPPALAPLVTQALRRTMSERPELSLFAAELRRLAPPVSSELRTKVASLRTDERPPPAQSIAIEGKRCHMQWDQLSTTAVDNVRHCAQCKHDVVQVRSIAALVPLLGKHCVNFEPPEN